MRGQEGEQKGRVLGFCQEMASKVGAVVPHTSCDGKRLSPSFIRLPVPTAGRKNINVSWETDIVPPGP